MDEELKLIDTQTRAEKIKIFLLDNKKTLLSISLGLILIVFNFYYYQTYKTKQTELASNKYNTAVTTVKGNAFLMKDLTPVKKLLGFNS